MASCGMGACVSCSSLKPFIRTRSRTSRCPSGKLTDQFDETWIDLQSLGPVDVVGLTFWRRWRRHIEIRWLVAVRIIHPAFE